MGHAHATSHAYPSTLPTSSKFHSEKRTQVPFRVRLILVLFQVYTIEPLRWLSRYFPYHPALEPSNLCTRARHAALDL